MSDNVEFLTARDIISESMRKYHSLSGSHVHSSSLHDKYYTGALKDWKTFEDEVVLFHEGIRWDGYLEILGYNLREEPIGSMKKEHYACGEEISTSGRYVNNGLQPAGGVAKQLGYPTMYGDWKATSQRTTAFKYGLNGFERVRIAKNKTTAKGRGQIDSKGQTDDNKSVLIPDYALIDSDGEPRAIGEAKTPWNHDFLAFWLNRGGSDSELPHLLGQPFKYMQFINLKYGFVTNYDHTFFLMQGYEEMLDGKREVLYCSPPIHYECSYDSELNLKKPSVRMCLLYLHELVRNNWEFKSQRQDRSTTRAKAEPKAGFDARVAHNTLYENRKDITPVRPRHSSSAGGDVEGSPSVRKRLPSGGLAESLGNLRLGSGDHGDSGARGGTYEKGPSKSRRHGKSVAIDENVTEIEHGYHSSPLKSYQPGGGKPTTHQTIHPSLRAPAPQASQGYPHNTASHAYMSYDSATLPQVQQHGGTEQAYSYGTSGQEMLSSNYGEERSGTRPSRASGPFDGDPGEYQSLERSRPSRTPSERYAEQHTSRDRDHESTASSRPRREPEPNPYDRPRNQNRRLQKGNDNKYSRP